MGKAATHLLDRILNGELILADGAWGTELQHRGLEDGACPEEWNLSHAKEVQAVAQAYYEAGAEIGLTNTFGGNKFRLNRHGFGNRVREINVVGARLCKQIADACGAIAAGSVGPSGEFLEPTGLISRSEMYEAFLAQIEALKEGGMEIVLIETFSALDEVEEAIKAARDLDMICMASMTFDNTKEGFRTMVGVPPRDAAIALESFGADVVGTNCGHGIEDMVQIVGEMRTHTSKPLMVRSNAGLPKFVGGHPVYGESPEWMASRIGDLKKAGANIIGGCCGTTPAHIRAFKREIDRFKAPA